MLVGLTGGIGSGKSTAISFFTELNIPVIKADEVIHALIQPHTPAYEAIVKKLGQDVLDSTLALNKAKLRQIIFSDLPTRIWLEELLHPKLYQIMEAQIKQIKAPYCVLEIPLLIEKPPHFTIDRTIVVDCELEQQIARAVKRDNMSINEVKKIISLQTDRQTRLRKCHDIIVNNGSLTDLKKAVTKLHNQYIKESSRS